MYYDMFVHIINLLDVLQILQTNREIEIYRTYNLIQLFHKTSHMIAFSINFAKELRLKHILRDCIKFSTYVRLFI